MITPTLLPLDQMITTALLLNNITLILPVLLLFNGPRRKLNTSINVLAPQQVHLTSLHNAALLDGDKTLTPHPVALDNHNLAFTLLLPAATKLQEALPTLKLTSTHHNSVTQKLPKKPDLIRKVQKLSLPQLLLLLLQQFPFIDLICLGF